MQGLRDNKALFYTLTGVYVLMILSALDLPGLSDFFELAPLPSVEVPYAMHLSLPISLLLVTIIIVPCAISIIHDH
jgi:hypothetical protein